MIYSSAIHHIWIFLGMFNVILDGIEQWAFPSLTSIFNEEQAWIYTVVKRKRNL